MNQVSYQISANLVNRMQRAGIEVVESPFEHERRPGRLRGLLAGWARRLSGWGERPGERGSPGRADGLSDGVHAVVQLFVRTSWTGGAAIRGVITPSKQRGGKRRRMTGVPPCKHSRLHRT